MKKTAVQKLIDYLEQTYIFVDGGQTRQEFKKALEEEMEQIETAFIDGDDGRNNKTDFYAKQYYSQTFKND